MGDFFVAALAQGGQSVDGFCAKNLGIIAVVDLEVGVGVAQPAAPTVPLQGRLSQPFPGVRAQIRMITLSARAGLALTQKIHQTFYQKPDQHSGQKQAADQPIGMSGDRGGYRATEGHRVAF